LITGGGGKRPQLQLVIPPNDTVVDELTEPNKSIEKSFNDSVNQVTDNLWIASCKGTQLYCDKIKELGITYIINFERTCETPCDYNGLVIVNSPTLIQRKESYR